MRIHRGTAQCEFNAFVLRLLHIPDVRTTAIIEGRLVVVERDRGFL